MTHSVRVFVAAALLCTTAVRLESNHRQWQRERRVGRLSGQPKKAINTLPLHRSTPPMFTRFVPAWEYRTGDATERLIFQRCMSIRSS